MLLLFSSIREVFRRLLAEFGKQKFGLNSYEICKWLLSVHTKQIMRQSYD